MAASEAHRTAPAAPSSSRRICRHATARYVRWRTGSDAAQERRHSLPQRVVGPRAPARRTAAPRDARRLLRGLIGEQRDEERERDAAPDRRRIEGFPRGRIDPIEVERRKLLHDRRQDGVLGIVEPLADGRARELERQRVAAHEAVDPRGLCLVAPRPAEHLRRVRPRKRPSGSVRSSSPNDARHTAPGASRVARTTRACSGSDGRNVWRSHPSSGRRRSAVSTMRTTGRSTVASATPGCCSGSAGQDRCSSTAAAVPMSARRTSASPRRCRNSWPRRPRLRDGRASRSRRAVSRRSLRQTEAVVRAHISDALLSRPTQERARS
jgi:hypothetical protein